MEMTYNNEFGTVVLSGEGRDGLSVCNIDGLELFGKERSLIKFYNTDGYRESEARFGQRIITVAGDVKNNDEIANAIRVFSKAGILRISTSSYEREIYINDTVFKISSKNGIYKAFAVQFTADDPHFTDCDDIFSGVYSRHNLITDQTYLPAIFTQRESGGTIENTGDVITEPQITIECLEDAPENGSIMLENVTNGGSITINYKTSEGEIITVDIPERIIKSSINGDITDRLAPQSYLCDIYLDCGENEFAVMPYDGNRNCEIYIVYRNKYTGMVI